MRRPDWDYDLGYGEEGERIAKAWHAGTHETKRKRRHDAYFYVELEQMPFGHPAKPSAVATSRAQYLEYVIDDTGVIVALPLAKALGLALAGKGRAAEERDGDCPTRGRLLSFADLMTVVVAGCTLEDCDGDPEWHCRACGCHLTSPYFDRCPQHQTGVP